MKLAWACPKLEQCKFNLFLPYFSE